MLREAHVTIFHPSSDSNATTTEESESLQPPNPPNEATSVTPNFYTVEDVDIIMYIYRHNAHDRVRGNKLWKEMEQKLRHSKYTLTLTHIIIHTNTHRFILILYG